jgi:hypothetical protein
VGCIDVAEDNGIELSAQRTGTTDLALRLLGVQRDLDKVIVYRSRTQLLMNGGLAIRTALQRRIRNAKLWLNEERRKNSRISRIVITSVKSVKRLDMRRYFAIAGVTIHDGMNAAMHMLDLPIKQFV